MVRFGLCASDSEDEEMAPQAAPSFASPSLRAPTNDDASDDDAADAGPPLSKARRSFSPGGLFSTRDGYGRAEASPGARDRLGIAAQLDLDADAVGRRAANSSRCLQFVRSVERAWGPLGDVLTGFPRRSAAGAARWRRRRRRRRRPWSATRWS